MEKRRQRSAISGKRAGKAVEAERGWTGKLQVAMDGGKHKKELEEAEFQRLEQASEAETRANSGLSGKLREALDDSTDELAQRVRGITGSQRVGKASVQEHADQEHLSDKVRNLLLNAPAEERAEQTEHGKVRAHDGRAPAGNKPGDAGWKDQLRVLAGASHKEEKEQVERSWLKEKLNNIAGGGAAGEANEDKLDKTIDLVQQYILKQGDQSDESALENIRTSKSAMRYVSPIGRS